VGQILSGMDLCFDPANKGNPDGLGEYVMGFGLISRQAESDPWTKVNGFSENVTKNTDFLLTFYDLSGQVSQIQAVISWRPSTPGSDDSPFSDSDFKEMDRGKTLSSAGSAASCGCGTNGGTTNGNQFTFGHYTFKNSGSFEVTIEATMTYGATTLTFKCDPKIIVGS